MRTTYRLLTVATAAAALAAATPAPAAIIFGLTTNNVLFNVDSATPNNVISAFAISGYTSPGENIVAIDFRPSTGQLFALGSFGQLYTLNTATAALTAVGAGIGPINGTAFGFDFNPTIDRIRLVSDTNKNSVINPFTGALQLAATDVFYPAADPNVGADPNAVGAAYSNNHLGVVPPSSQLYVIDSGLDILATQANNTGVLGTVGPLLTVNTSNLVGFDIDTDAQGINTAYASLTPVGGSVSNLYTINLATGAAILVGPFSGGTLVADIAVVPTPEPTTPLALAALTTLTSLRPRRRSTN